MSRVLILGGVGFIGRNLVQYLLANNLASKICVADKVLPEVAGLSEAEMANFKSDKVTFKQCNLARDGSFSAFFFVFFLQRSCFSLRPLLAA
jgi:nucleoside-diphosphate-sugar epimerase